MSQKTPPRYRQISDSLRERIRAGEWTVGEAIPTEEALTREFGVARMTVNRALRELVDAGLLRRTQGSGSFVAPLPVESSLVSIRNIADEIVERGHRHTCRIEHLGRATASAEKVLEFGLKRGATLFHSLIVHCENNVPLQIEDRWVNPAVAPAYLDQDYTRQTPSAYLSSVAPLTSASYLVEARLPLANIAKLLEIRTGSPCLVITRTTRTEHAIASLATLWHPGERHRLTGTVSA